MSIVAAEIKAYRSTTVSDAGGNGGRLSSSEIVSAQLAGLFPNVTPAERTAGLTRYRKFFQKVANDDDIPLVNPRFWQDRNTVGDDRVIWWPATQRDTQSSITGSERKYGCGALQATVLSGVSQIVVTVEQGATVVFVNGDTIRITDKLNLADSGNEEFLTISGVPSVAGNNVTIDFTPALANGYVAADSHVSSVYEPADIQGSFDNFVVTSGAGLYNEITNPVDLDHIGTVEQTWTLLFTNATTYTITGDTIGSVGTGNVGSGAAPTNGAFSKPYFTLAPGGFSGTFVGGDTIVFQTHPAALAVWARQVVPAAAAVASSNVAAFILSGETA